MGKYTSDQIVSKFIKSILDWVKHEENPTKANQCMKDMHRFFKELRTRGDLKLLRPLLEHEEHYVVHFAAQYFLLEDETTALRYLRKLSEEDSVRGFAASNIIERWQSGELNFDY